MLCGVRGSKQPLIQLWAFNRAIGCAMTRKQVKFMIRYVLWLSGGNGVIIIGTRYMQCLWFFFKTSTGFPGHPASSLFVSWAPYMACIFTQTADRHGQYLGCILAYLAALPETHFHWAQPLWGGKMELLYLQHDGTSCCCSLVTLFCELGFCTALVFLSNCCLL